MTVELPARHAAAHADVVYSFCSEGCLASFEADRTRYLKEPQPG